MTLLEQSDFVGHVITAVTRVILLPNIHQQKTGGQDRPLAFRLAKLQKLGAPDLATWMKLQQETQDLYAREGHNPMQMGCGPMLFQMVFLMGIIGDYLLSRLMCWDKAFADQSANIAQVVQGINISGPVFAAGYFGEFRRL